MKKKLSIIIPIYNNKAVGKAIESIHKTDAMEIIVVDGGSNNETLSVINQYMDKIDCFVSEKDNGLYDAMNKGIKIAKGDWIFTLASDDQLICDPLSIIEKYEDGNYDLICGSLIAKDFKERFFVIRPDMDMKKLELECSLCHPGAFFRKSVYEKFGGYDLEYKCAADHEIFLRFYKLGISIKVIPELISFFAYGGTSTTNPWRAFKEDVRISDKYGISKYKSRKNMLVRVLRFYGAKVKDIFKIKHNTQFMDCETLLIYLNDHPEVLTGYFIKER